MTSRESHISNYGAETCFETKKLPSTFHMSGLRVNQALRAYGLKELLRQIARIPAHSLDPEIFSNKTA